MADEDVEMENFSEERAESASDFAADDENEKVNVFKAVLLKKDFWRVGHSKVSNSFVSVWSDLSKGFSVISPTSWSVNLVYYRYIRRFAYVSSLLTLKWSFRYKRPSRKLVKMNKISSVE